MFNWLFKKKENRIKEVSDIINKINTSLEEKIKKKEKIFVITQMPCGCPVGTHPPDCHNQPPANPCMYDE